MYPLFILASAIVLVAAGSVQFTGSTLELGGIPYYVPPTPVSQFDICFDVAQRHYLDLIPFSVVSIDEVACLESTFEDWKVRDDVWTESFLMGIYVDATSSISSSIIHNYHIQIILTSPFTNLPSGPYFLSPLTGKVYQAYRLYSDENQAFLYGIIPASNGTFRQLPAHTDGAHTATIGVPSRLYFTPTPEKPLAGYRLAVKDIFDIAGLKTGCGNRAFYQIHEAKNTTAPAIQRLLDAGMVLIGKTKTSQFANGELATDDWVDLHAPYNPRGDGYQDSSSSSTGSASAMASYDWLDFAVGSDTGGSMRGPAGKCGLYGNRPSFGALTLDGVMPLSPALDTVGIFSRDAALWANVAKVWYTDSQDYRKYPSKLLFPVDAFGTSFTTYPPRGGSTDAIFDSFLKKVEGFLGVNRTEVNLSATWMESRPPNILATSLNEFLNTTYADLISLDQIGLLADPFFEVYGAVHEGRAPFVNPAPSTQWAYGETLPDGRYQEAIANKTIFKSWIESEVLRGGQPDTCSDAILVYPQSKGITKYRNSYIQAPTPPFGWSFIHLAVHAEVPDMVVPVGEQAYHSTITYTTEYLPVTMSFLAAKNCDLMLFNLFADLQERGILLNLRIGSRLY